jgi:hypothetical protein
MINAGAITTHALSDPKAAAGRGDWSARIGGRSAFADRRLEVDESV